MLKEVQASMDLRGIEWESLWKTDFCFGFYTKINLIIEDMYFATKLKLQNNKDESSIQNANVLIPQKYLFHSFVV